MKRRQTVLFILSADYSGSTWIGYVLGSHPSSAFLGEYYRAWREGLGQPCASCAARGLPECELLHGIEDVPQEQAFTWAFQRTGKMLLVDSSKVTDWAAMALRHQGDYDARLIHLVRDPRGWFASQRRRDPALAVAETLAGWVASNAAIQSFVAQAHAPVRTVLYDECAHDPLGSFRQLFGFCGLNFDPDALEYWRVPHHGFAANGATSPTIPEDAPPERIPHFVTRDEAFYRTRRRSQFTDDRWTTELRSTEIEEISTNSAVEDFLRSIGRRLATDGVAEIPAPAPR